VSEASEFELGREGLASDNRDQTDAPPTRNPSGEQPSEPVLLGTEVRCDYRRFVSGERRTVLSWQAAVRGSLPFLAFDDPNRVGAPELLIVRGRAGQDHRDGHVEGETNGRRAHIPFVEVDDRIEVAIVVQVLEM